MSEGISQYKCQSELFVKAGGVWLFEVLVLQQISVLNPPFGPDVQVKYLRGDAVRYKQFIQSVLLCKSPDVHTTLCKLSTLMLLLPMLLVNL